MSKKELAKKESSKIALFEDNEIRRVSLDDE